MHETSFEKFVKWSGNKIADPPRFLMPNASLRCLVPAELCFVLQNSTDALEQRRMRVVQKNAKRMGRQVREAAC